MVEERSRWPVRYVGASGGYDIQSRPAADREALLKFFRDILKGSSNRTIVLPRSIADGVDDCKFMYSILPGLPIAAMSMVNIAMSGASAGAIGNEDQRVVAGAVNAVLPKLSQLGFSAEGADIGQNWNILMNLLNLPDSEPMVFTSSDIPLSYNLFWSLMDRQITGHDLVLSLNTKELIGDLFDRNYYDALVKEVFGDRIVYHWKEPNRIVANRRGLSVVGREISEIYRHRREGGLITYGLGKIGRAWFNNVGDTELFLRGLNYFLHKRGDLEGHALTEAEGSKLASDFMNSWKERQDPVRLAVVCQHKDPFAVRDVDGLHDFLWTRGILEAALGDGDYSRLAAIYPHWEVLEQVRAELSGKLPIVEGFDEFLCAKVERLNSYLAAFGAMYRDEIEGLRRRRFREEMDGYVKQMEATHFPEPIVDGRVNLELLAMLEGKRIHDVSLGIIRAVEFLRRTYLPRYSQERRIYEDALSGIMPRFY